MSAADDRHPYPGDDDLCRVPEPRGATDGAPAVPRRRLWGGD